MEMMKTWSAAAGGDEHDGEGEGTQHQHHQQQGSSGYVTSDGVLKEEEDEDDGHDSDAEEDAWLQMEIVRMAEEEQQEPVDVDAYKPQFMDEPEMRSLRRELRTSEARVQRDGHLKEFVASRRKPTTAPSGSGSGAGTSRKQRYANAMRAPYSSNIPSNITTARVVDDHEEEEPLQKQEYAKALQAEVNQFTKLYEQYEETKKLLLEQLDTVCTTKPSERASGSEAYEKLDELLAFVAKCAV